MLVSSEPAAFLTRRCAARLVLRSAGRFFLSRKEVLEAAGWLLAAAAKLAHSVRRTSRAPDSGARDDARPQEHRRMRAFREDTLATHLVKIKEVGDHWRIRVGLEIEYMQAGPPLKKPTTAMRSACPHHAPHDASLHPFVLLPRSLFDISKEEVLALVVQYLQPFGNVAQLLSDELTSRQLTVPQPSTCVFILFVGQI